VNYKSLAVKTSDLESHEQLADDESPFSTNRVTGYSINYPIAETCAPTSVCVETCYFGRGPSTWTGAIKKQWRVYRSTVADPAGFAARVCVWAARHRIEFVRWNGGGDLFPESVAAINRAAELQPLLLHWVVTRLPDLATSIRPAANVYVHFSIDRSSWKRAAGMLGYGGQWFWSYQGAPGEEVPAGLAPVTFFDGYDPGGAELGTDHCPLNAADDITGVCGRCRRCFDGTAVERGRQLLPMLEANLAN
jgi:hypothetical protein